MPRKENGFHFPIRKYLVSDLMNMVVPKSDKKRDGSSMRMIQSCGKKAQSLPGIFLPRFIAGSVTVSVSSRGR
jgi:hypothetical protein